MVAYLAAAVEAAYQHGTRIRGLLQTSDLGPPRFITLFQHKDYDERRVGSYALCLAAGYATLLCPTMGWNIERLAESLAKAQHFFFDLSDLHGGQAGVILRILALKYAACRLVYLHARQDFSGIATEATRWPRS